ncbi:MAG TPA: hypothetical protein DCW87_12720 [Comamonadaceae bacterium]|nr:hypothetical protein [Comamonadaceae bacterium]
MRAGGRHQRPHVGMLAALARRPLAWAAPVPCLACSTTRHGKPVRQWRCLSPFFFRRQEP